MRSVIKKVAAAVLAVVLAASLCGCDRGYIMTVDGMEIRNGVYLSFLGTAYSMAMAEVEERKSDDDSADDSTAEIPVTEEQLDGKSGSQWIKDETMKAVRRFVAIQRMCDDLGISLTEEELGEINTEITESWDTENDYLIYVFGISTLGEYYESQGIGQESLKEIRRVNKLQEKLFMYYYDKGGELEVSESEIDEYLKDKYATVKLLTLSFADALGTSYETDEEKDAVKENARKYADRINNGESPVDIFYEYNLSRAQEAAEKNAETYYEEDNEDGLSKEDWIKQQVEASGVTKAESEDDLDRFISKESSSFDEKTTEYIFNAPTDGKATVFEAENCVYIIIKEDITKKTSWKEDNHENILNDLKGDDFQNMLDLFGQNYEVISDDSLVNKKYRPETLNS